VQGGLVDALLHPRFVHAQDSRRRSGARCPLIRMTDFLRPYFAAALVMSQPRASSRALLEGPPRVGQCLRHVSGCHGHSQRYPHIVPSRPALHVEVRLTNCLAGQCRETALKLPLTGAHARHPLRRLMLSRTIQLQRTCPATMTTRLPGGLPTLAGPIRLRHDNPLASARSVLQTRQGKPSSASFSTLHSILY
jgi:hypothetical protein